MAGTKQGGISARDTNYKLYGPDFYAKIGAVGGTKGHTGGFYKNRELARIAGAKGGKISKRGRKTIRVVAEADDAVVVSVETQRGLWAKVKEMFHG